MRRLSPLLFCALLGAASSPVATAESEAIELPIDAQLTAGSVMLELRGGEVEVVFDAEAAPALHIADLVNPDSTEGFVVLDQQEGALRVTQPHGDETVAPRLRVRLVAPPGFQVEIAGDRLTVAVEDLSAERPADFVPPPEEPAQPGARPRPREAPAEAAIQPPAAPALRLDLRDSTATLVGAAGRIKGRDAHVRVQSVRGTILADLEGGRLLLEGVEGPVDVRAVRADVSGHSLTSQIALRLDRATLDIESGAGRVSGTSEGSTVVLRDWHGAVSLTGDGNRVELLRAGAAESEISLSGARNEFTLAELRSPLKLDVVDGRVAARELRLAATLRARGGELAIERAGGRLTLDVAEAARASVSGATQGLDARVESSSATFVGAHDLELRAQAATIEASEVTGAVRVNASDSELTLDLRSVAAAPELELRGATLADVTLAPPCLVLLDRSEDAAERVDLVGCEIHDGRRRPVAATGQRALLTRARVGEAARLTARAASR